MSTHALPVEASPRSSDRKDWSRSSAPVGTIRVRQTGDKGKMRREIKVAMEGPKGTRWTGYARWWWEQNKGPVPAGMRVLHADGDTLNDEPSNLILGNAGDLIRLCHTLDPAMSRKNLVAIRRGTREHNRKRASDRRRQQWLPSKWYPVDHIAKKIHNKPVRKRYQVWPAVGFAISASPNGGLCDAAALGWPQRKITEAMIMAALLDGPLETGELLGRVNALRIERGDAAFVWKGCLWQNTGPLVRLGLIACERRGACCSVFSITEQGRASRGVWTPVVPVRGKDLAGPAYAEYSSSCLAASVARAVAAKERREARAVAAEQKRAETEARRLAAAEERKREKVTQIRVTRVRRELPGLHEDLPDRAVMKSLSGDPALRLQKAIAGLGLVERVVLKLTLFPKMLLTLEEVGVVLGVTKETVRNVERSAIEKIRGELRDEMEDAA